MENDAEDAQLAQEIEYICIIDLIVLASGKTLLIN
jgi:hypothetical protein